MRDEYDFSGSRPNPYVESDKEEITIPVDVKVISYFKTMAEESGMHYQNLMALYLKQCATDHARPCI